MPLLSLKDANLSYGTHVLLDSVSLTLEKGMRIGLLGRNGAGKSTLLKLIAGEIHADSGERWVQPGIKIAWLEQSLPDADDSTVYEVVASGLAEIGDLLAQYYRLTMDESGDNLDKLQSVQSRLEAKDGWSLGQRVDTVISQLDLPAQSQMRTLSGGWRKRVALGRALVRQPDLLLLDEPTNHLDILTIEWLEKQVQNFSGALLLVTHDRTFLQRVTNNIAELDRGHLHLVEQDFRRFLMFREQQLAAEADANAKFDKKLAEEEVWIRKGIQARRTRNEGRVRALEALRVERQQRRVSQSKGRFDIDSAGIAGKIVAELDKVSHSYDDNKVINDFSCLIQRGDRIGLVGANGAGKTTLLKLILGKLQPTEGSVKLGTRLEVVYFDQLRALLDGEKTLLDNVCGGQTHIEVGGKVKHGISYLGEFLFTPDRVRTPVKALSGGEQNRAILAILFSKPANVLVLDEPTNDLDIETLELLEEILLKFAGTVLLVSHDREFMDKVVTSILVFEADAKIQEYAGGYQDWVERGGSLERIQTLQSREQGEEQRGEKLGEKLGEQKGEQSSNDSPEKKNSAVQAPSPASQSPSPPKRKLSYKEKRELELLPKKIEELETRQQTLQTLIADPQFYKGDKAQVQLSLQEVTEVQNALDASYTRWEELEGS